MRGCGRDVADRRTERLMIGRFLAKLRRDPVGTVWRVLDKTLVARMRYRAGRGDYDAARYWRDRFAAHGTGLRGAGDEGLSDEENRREYEAGAAALLALCERHSVLGPGVRVVEIGCGSGFYTRLLAGAGVTDVLGVDITDVLFDRLAAEFPRFRFERRDVTRDRIGGVHDLAVLIDVIEHIVTDSKLSAALAAVDAAIAPGGLLLLAPVAARPRRHLYYVRMWSRAEIDARLPGYAEIGRARFRSGELLLLRKPG